MTPAAPDAPPDPVRLEQEIETLRDRTRRLIKKQSSAATDELAALYDDEINAINHLIEENKRLLAAVRATRHDQYAIDEIRKIGIDALWECPDVEINRILRALLGKNKIPVSTTQKRVILP